MGKDTTVCTGMHDMGHLDVKCCTKSTQSEDDSRDLAACYFPKEADPVQTTSKSPSYNCDVAVNYKIWVSFKCVLKFVQTRK